MEEQIINKIRKIKHQIRKIYVDTVKSIDLESETLAYSKELEELSLLSKIDEEITDIIYMILDNKNSQNNKN